MFEQFKGYPEIADITDLPRTWSQRPAHNKS